MLKLRLRKKLLHIRFYLVVLIITFSIKSLAQRKVEFIKYSCDNDSIGIIGFEEYNKSELLILKSETEPIAFIKNYVYDSTGRLQEEKVEFKSEKKYVHHYYKYTDFSQHWSLDSGINNEASAFEIISRYPINNTKDILKSNINKTETTLSYDKNSNIIYKTICLKIQDCITYKYVYENGNLTHEEIWNLDEKTAIPYLVQQTNHIYVNQVYVGSIFLDSEEKCLFHIKRKTSHN